MSGQQNAILYDLRRRLDAQLVTILKLNEEYMATLAMIDRLIYIRKCERISRFQTQAQAHSRTVNNAQVHPRIANKAQDTNHFNPTPGYPRNTVTQNATMWAAPQNAMMGIPPLDYWNQQQQHLPKENVQNEEDVSSYLA